MVLFLVVQILIILHIHYILIYLQNKNIYDFLLDYKKMLIYEYMYQLFHLNYEINDHLIINHFLILDYLELVYYVLQLKNDYIDLF